MYILTDKHNVIILKGTTIEFGMYDDPFKKWYIKDIGFEVYAIDDGYKKYTVEEVPDQCEYRYCYTEEQGFYINENFVEPFNIDEEVKRLITENEELKTTVSNLENNSVESEIETDFRLSMLELGLA